MLSDIKIKFQKERIKRLESENSELKEQVKSLKFELDSSQKRFENRFREMNEKDEYVEY